MLDSEAKARGDIPPSAASPVGNSGDPSAARARNEQQSGAALRTVVQRKVAVGGAGAVADADPKGAGMPLPDGVRAKMERSLNHDFSNVRIHLDGRAQRMGAEAFTQGNDIHFAPGKYDPDSPAGLELLGHELAHVVQQTEGRVAAKAQAKGPGLNDDPSLEQEADVMGARAAAGTPAREGAAVAPAAPVSGDAVQRKITIGGYPNEKEYEYKAFCEAFDTTIDTAPIPKELAHIAAKTVRLELRKKLQEYDETNKEAASIEALLEEAWEDITRPLLESHSKPEQLEDNEHRNRLELAVKDREQLINVDIEKLKKLPLERLMGISGLAQKKPKDVEKAMWVVRDLQVSTLLGKLCDEYGKKLESIALEISKEPNHLEGRKEGIKEVGMKLVKEHPPDECVYISLGASPSVVTKYIELTQKAEVHELPLSGLSGARASIKTDWENKDKRERLCGFIDGYLEKMAATGKRVVVVDFSTGGSLYAAEFIIGKYLLEKKKIGNQNQVVPLTLLAPTATNEEEAKTEKFKTDDAVVKPSKLTGLQLFTETFKAFSKDLQNSAFKQFGYRDTDENSTKMIMEGAHTQLHVLGGYERLTRDLKTIFDL